MEQRDGPDDGPDDQELVARARRGDVDAFELLYRQHRDWVVTLAYRFCGHREDALDVMQETFAYVLRKLPDLELRSQMRTFLYPAVKHLALSRARAGRREVSLDEASASAAGAATERDAAEDSEALEALVAGLPDEQREVVWMRFVDGFRLREIAAALEIPLGTVKSRLHNALETLRRR